jgi:hypothetical protein
MTMDNHEIVRLLGMGITWEGIQREAERRGLKYERPRCHDCGEELYIDEVVRDAKYCYACEKKQLEEQARRNEQILAEEGLSSDDQAEAALYGFATLARFLPVPWLIGGVLLIAAVFGLARASQKKPSEGAPLEVSGTS